MEREGGKTAGAYMAYVLLVRSGTWVSRGIHALTGDAYTHAAICLDGPEGPFQSFGRKHRMFCLPGGFVDEPTGIYRPGTPCVLYGVPLSHGAYLHLRWILSHMRAHREEYKYDLAGLFACGTPLRVPRREGRFFCSQFVAWMLAQTGEVALSKPPERTHPVDLCYIPKAIVIHEGTVGGLPGYAGAGRRIAPALPRPVARPS